ncbi:hypothetical protein JX265_013659 [Neoarthrinium moseri]|uniref:Alpha-galactosidase n=1 Tax=Neoarthrinium moseri TaxID=1658444 RepID=A0A9Q0AIC2_9PEZI|nr:hypothetical protein JX266_013895 [Neoarthrinium moseri]KAI1849273.1 hypothetical protein JX265_013659 [Neoarthrinium moseri]
MHPSYVVAVLAGTVSATAIRRLDNGLGKTPALGWNSWNQGGCDAASASVALATAKAFVDRGLKDVGYTYVNIDDCWSAKSRNSSGYLVPDSSKFPKGMKELADQIHDLGLKLGLYGDAGTLTCGGYPGSQGYEQKDAQLLASWGIDYWKYDNCYTPCNSGTEQTCSSPAGTSQTWYVKMRDYLLSTNHPILYSLCNWGRDDVWTWGASVGNSWRMSIDNWGAWADVVRIASAAGPIAQYAGPGAFNDLDMMVGSPNSSIHPCIGHVAHSGLYDDILVQIIGNGKLTNAEERTHFGLWAITKSPILMGTDMTTLSTTRLNLIKNKGILAINQDPLGNAATTFTPSGKSPPVSGQLYRYWAGKLSDGVVIGLVASDGAETLSVNFADVPDLGSGAYNWIELFTGSTGSGTSVAASLDSHDMAIYKVTRT